VFAATDLDGCGPEISSVGAQSFEGDSVEVQQLRGTKLELALRIGKVIEQFADGIELFQSIPGFYSRYLVRIAYEFGFQSSAMPIQFLAHASALLESQPPGRPFPS
jgi:hypothetical protein